MRKSAAGDNTIFVYDAAGKLIEEYSGSTLQTAYVYAGSRLLSTETSSGTNYLTSDHLGSLRVNTDQSGTVTARHDYHPFGEEIPRTGYGSDVNRKQFTGYERDEETELDFAQARMYAWRLGRFSRPDDIGGNRFEPQSLNRFVYVLNNPLKLIDPSGFSWENPHGHSKKSNIWMDTSKFQLDFMVWREWVNKDGRPVWVPPAEYAAKQTDLSKLPLWTEMTYSSEDGEVNLDPNGPNPNTPWGWTLDKVAVGDPSQPALPPSPPGENAGADTATGVPPMGMSFMGDPRRNALSMYWDVSALRSKGQALFPDTRGLDAERHRWASRQAALHWGTGTSRTFGVLNEIQGFLWHDLGPAINMVRGVPVARPTWAFQWSDLQHNEVGISEASVILNQPKNNVP